MTDDTDTNNEILCPLYTAAEETPDRLAIVRGATRLTYLQFEQAVRYYAEMFRAVELAPEQQVLFYSRNRIELPAALLACWRVGTVATLLNYRYPFDQALVHDAIPENAGMVFFGDVPIRLPDGVSPIELDPLHRIGVSTGRTLPQIRLDQPATIMFTSGSTGTPKAVLHSYGNHYCSALGSNKNIPVTESDRWLLSLPLYHVGGLAIVFRCLIGRATIVLAQPDEELVSQIEQQQVTHVSLVATQLQRLVNSLETDSRRLPLKAILLGGGPTPQPLVDRALKLGLPLYRSYGLTEMASQVVTSSKPDGSARVVLPYRDLKLADDGEILVRGKTRFVGYRQADGLHQPFDTDGWFATGDLGEMTPDGLMLRGRKDNLFVSGGENVYPEEIERALIDIEGVRQAVVVAVDDAEFGQRPVAFIDGDDVDAEQLTEELR
ncbi:o-succinylbenzoate--CoA ligase, partial [candidate division GN15 bacterium]|nr:o-succinylbenzoate--CoA ligase [candidate division GN15 bacterium]